MDTVLNTLAKTVRSWMLVPAKVINKISRGRIKPNHITLVSLLGHGLIVWALWNARPILAAVLLIFFGLMDALDGALARIQGTTSVRGMFYDATSDRAKEILVYSGIAIYLETVGLYGSDITIVDTLPRYLYFWIPVAVLGLSMLVSYIKAKGEMALSTIDYDAQKLNRLFSDGFARYEVRMFIIVVGLLTGRIMTALCILLVLLIFTCIQRLVKVSKAIGDV